MTFLRAIFLPYSSIFELGFARLGAFLVLITFLDLNLAISGLLGIFFATVYLRLFEISLSAPTAQAVLRNSLLTGLVIGNLLALNFQILLFLAIFVIATISLTTAMESLFARLKLPTLSLPFCLIALLIFILLPNISRFSHAPIALWKLDISGFLPDFAVYFFHSIASLFCIINPAIGLIIWLAIAIFSPLTALFLLAGFFIGDYAESLFHAPNHSLAVYSDGYNYSLIFTAIAGFFLTPSRLSIILASLITFASSILVVASSNLLNWWHLPILSLPFNLVLLTTLLSLKTLRPSLLNIRFFESPEKNLEISSLLKSRHRFGEIGVFLPICGRWKIQQAFNGKITHRGLWRHALDFVLVDQNDKIFANKGLDLHDHFSFGKDVFSPIDGQVVASVGDEPDNQINQVSNCRNWGNHLIIKSHFGFFAVLSHLKKDSLLVKTDDFVKAAQKLAQCGNSGYSPEPHLHLQVQYSPEIGATTAPFHLMNYASKNQLHFHRTPLLDEVVENLNLNCAVEKILNFKIGEKMIFAKQNQAQIQEQITITAQVDETSGEFYLSDGVSKIYHAKIGVQFYFYGFVGKKNSALRDLMIAAPRIPMIYGKEVEFCDELPAKITHNIFWQIRHQLKQILQFKAKNSQTKYRLDSQGLSISGSHQFSSKTINSFFKLDPAFGIQEFAVGDQKYFRVL